MHYQITHTTCYTYSAPAQLRPHTLRLCPRSDGAQWLDRFQLHCSPATVRQHHWLDAQGNTCVQMAFADPIPRLQLDAVSQVRTTRQNPFDYLAAPWAVTFPIDYPSALAAQLQPYWSQPVGWPVDSAIAPAVLNLAQSLRHSAQDNVGLFLTQLTQQIPEKHTYQPRLEGAPQPPSLTLATGSGTCRDFAVLFMAVCRAVGLAARFVSGYQEGDLTVPPEQRHHDLHAWAEVYVPGGGWRGFDPTLGLVVGDRHIAIAAAIDPQQAAPVSGRLQAGQQVEVCLESKIELTALPEMPDTPL